jgi:rSAM/selenodomain-associated transferase 1
MERLILFAKRPRLGAVKTRLVPPLSEEQALALHRAFIEDQVTFLRSLGGSRMVELCCDEPWKNRPAEIGFSEQGHGDLGDRMFRAFERSRSRGATATIIIGADCPTLPSAHVVQAFSHLEAGLDAVVTPAEDGGYVLIGLRKPRAELFNDLPWGTSRILELTRARADEHGIELAMTDIWYDVDDINGIRRLERDPSTPARAPATARCLGSLAL